MHGGLYTWLRLKIYKNQEAVSTQFNEESKQPRRALVMIVMYIAAKTCSPDPSSRYLIDWGNSSRKADRAEKFTSQCDSSWAGHARSIARITRRFISGHMVRSSGAGTSKVYDRLAVSPAVSSFATAQRPFHRFIVSPRNLKVKLNFQHQHTVRLA